MKEFARSGCYQLGPRIEEPDESRFREVKGQ
jgi:hypothetical protein